MKISKLKLYTALIVSYFLPKKVKLYAMLDWFDFVEDGYIEIDCPKYKLRVEKELK